MDPAKGGTSAGDIAEILQQEILSSNITGKYKHIQLHFDNFGMLLGIFLP